MKYFGVSFSIIVVFWGMLMIYLNAPYVLACLASTGKLFRSLRVKGFVLAINTFKLRVKRNYCIDLF